MKKAPAKKTPLRKWKSKSMAKERFERHKQPWNGEEAGKLRVLATKGMGLKAIAKALNRSEESTKKFAKNDGIKIAKKR